MIQLFWTNQEGQVKDEKQYIAGRWIKERADRGREAKRSWVDEEEKEEYEEEEED